MTVCSKNQAKVFHAQLYSILIYDIIWYVPSPILMGQKTNSLYSVHLVPVLGQSLFGTCVIHITLNASFQFSHFHTTTIIIKPSLVKHNHLQSAVFTTMIKIRKSIFRSCYFFWQWGPLPTMNHWSFFLLLIALHCVCCDDLSQQQSPSRRPRLVGSETAGMKPFWLQAWIRKTVTFTVTAETALVIGLGMDQLWGSTISSSWTFMVQRNSCLPTTSSVIGSAGRWLYI
jgi:hypothetical protein